MHNNSTDVVMNLEPLNQMDSHSEISHDQSSISTSIEQNLDQLSSESTKVDTNFTEISFEKVKCFIQMQIN